MTVKKTNRKRKNLFDGSKPGPGRPKGMPNKTTTLLKDAILQAATEAGEGNMVNYLRMQAAASPGPFLTLLGKVLPMQVVGPDDGDGMPTAIQITIVDPKR